MVGGFRVAGLLAFPSPMPPMIQHGVTRDEYLALADQAYQACLAAQATGDREAALRMKEVADYYRGRALTAAKSSANLREMTGVQLQRRGRAIAAAKNAKTKDRLLKAITASQWGSQERYAKERLRISPPALTGYRNGTTPCPRVVADRVLQDFEIPHEYWPAGVVN